MERVAIVGSGGSGKSTFARQIADAAGLPVIHLDREFWSPGWQKPPEDRWIARIAALASGERWVMDGNYGETMAVRFARADTIVFLDVGRLTCLYRVTKRRLTYRGRSRPDMAEGCDEQLDRGFLKWIWDYPNDQRPRVLALLEQARAEGKRVAVLRNTHQMRAFLEQAKRA